MFLVSTCLFSAGDLPLEELLAMYNLQRQSATPETDVDVEEDSQGEIHVLYTLDLTDHDTTIGPYYL